MVSPEILQAYASDFGRVLSTPPAAVAFPSSAEQVAHIVRSAAREGIPIAARGEGHSQAGQSLQKNGLVLATKALNRILEIRDDYALCEAGTLWCDLVDATLPHARLPPVLTNNLRVTVGGTLSTAGLGVSSFRYGTQADHCLELEVVTAAGERVTCSETGNRELFDAVRCGLGQWGIITRAKVRLRPVRPMVRTYYLLYDRLEALMRDLEPLLEWEAFDYLEAWCSPCPQGFRFGPAGRQPFARWFFPLHASVEFDPARPPDDDSLLSTLRPYEQVHREDLTLRGFVFRMDPLFELWKKSGYWSAAHPWMETLLPWESAASYVQNVLTGLPPVLLGGGHVLLWSARASASRVPLFMRPRSDRVLGFGILPGVPSEALPAAKAFLTQASDASMAAGGKRYLSGWIEFSPERWRQHFGDLWPGVVRLKQKYDPGNVFNPGWWPTS